LLLPATPVCITQPSPAVLAIRNWPRNQRVWQVKATGTGAAAGIATCNLRLQWQPATTANLQLAIAFAFAARLEEAAAQYLANLANV